MKTPSHSNLILIPETKRPFSWAAVRLNRFPCSGTAFRVTGGPIYWIVAGVARKALQQSPQARSKAAEILAKHKREGNRE
jgi:hypothetical protein